jgi:MFS family permease
MISTDKFKVHRASNQLILYPTPSSDPNDPLNWSKWRKALNFILICFFVLWTFVQLDIGFTAWGPLQEELGFSINTLNAAAAVNYAALGVGCLFFIPFVHKYGRRPLYIFSSVLQFASCVWQARTYTTGDIIGSNLVSGLGGAISETIVQITIADMFFVHQHATMNAWYLLFQSMGAFLGPVASGYVVVSEGWRWMWWWCVIFFGVNLLLVVFFFEESKYIPIEIGQRHPPTTQHEGIQTPIQDVKGGDVDFGRTHSEVDTESRPKSYRQRLALFTRSNASIKHHFYQPIILLFTFPAVAYTALTVGCTLSWFAILTSVQATYMIGPPYNFDAVGIGLMNVPPMIGAFFAFFVGGFLNDKSIIWLSKRNGGLYEPEMRLWLALPPALITPAGLLMFGLGLNYVRMIHPLQVVQPSENLTTARRVCTGPSLPWASAYSALDS